MILVILNFYQGVEHDNNLTSDHRKDNASDHHFYTAIRLLIPLINYNLIT